MIKYVFSLVLLQGKKNIRAQHLDKKKIFIHGKH